MSDYSLVPNLPADIKNLKYFGDSVIQYSFNKKIPSKYAWIVVERNEGERIIRQLNTMSKFSNFIDIIIVDGGSTDGSIKIDQLSSFGVKHLLISKAKKGFSRDLQIGLIFALRENYKGVVTNCGNGKDSVQDVGLFISALEAGQDFVQGSRFMLGGINKNTPIMRYIGIRFISSPITSFLGRITITDSTNGFRAYSRKLLLLKNLGLGTKDFRGYGLVACLPIIAGRNSLKCSEIPVERSYPSTGPTPTKIRLSQWLQILFDPFRSRFDFYANFSQKDQVILPPN
jgi:glycosyltransferase involved in cell wall biosynthesis